jgi:hypothetical protein
MRTQALRLAIAAAVVLGVAGVSPAAAQVSTTGASVTAADIQRLQDDVYSLGGEISALRSRDRQLASQLQNDLDDLRDEVTYLRVKQRKETVSRSEYTDLRNRLDDLRARVRGDTTGRTSGSSTSGPRSSDTGAGTGSGAGIGAGRSTDRASSTRGSGASVIPVGQEMDVRLQDTLNSGTSQVEDRFLATTLVDLQIDERTVIPAGSEMRGVVSAVNPAGRLDRKGSLTVTFDQLTVRGRTYPIRATVIEALESEGVRGEVGKIGTGAGIGAIIGGILGGVKGALAGILIGGGGVIAATEGKDVDLPAGTVLRVRLDSPPAIR